MERSALDWLKNIFLNGTALSRLLLANIGLFLLLHLCLIVFGLFNKPQWVMMVFNALALHSHPMDLAIHPWGLVTHMFLHMDFFHILSNMILLYFGGQIFSEMLGGKRLFTVYFLGGIAGAVLYVISYNVFPFFTGSSSIAYGASASTLAVMIAIATYIPHFTVRLILFGPVKLKYIAAFFVISDIVYFYSNNTGGHIAHLGGALYGYIFARYMLKGRDIGAWFNNFISSLGGVFKKHKPKMKVMHTQRPISDEQYNLNQKIRQEEVDSILDKISKSGYDSLSKKEKEILFRASKENK